MYDSYMYQVISDDRLQQFLREAAQYRLARLARRAARGRRRGNSASSK